MRPMTFEIRRYQLSALIATPHSSRDYTDTTGNSLAVNNCDPPTGTGQFAAVIGKRKTAQG